MEEWASVFIFTLAASIILIALFLIGFIYRYQNAKVMKSAQPVLMYAISTGIVIGGVSILLQGIRLTKESCVAYFWSYHISLFVILSAMILKSYRIHRIINNTTLKRVRFTAEDVLKRLLLAVAMLLAFLVIFTVMGRVGVSYQGVHDNLYQKQFPYCSFNEDFKIFTEVIELMMIATAMYYSYQVRNAPSSMNDFLLLSVCKYHSCIALCCAGESDHMICHSGRYHCNQLHRFLRDSTPRSVARGS
jgi:hypothetical protein